MIIESTNSLTYGINNSTFLVNIEYAVPQLQDKSHIHHDVRLKSSEYFVFNNLMICGT